MNNAAMEQARDSTNLLPQSRGVGNYCPGCSVEECKASQEFGSGLILLCTMNCHGRSDRLDRSYKRGARLKYLEHVTGRLAGRSGAQVCSTVDSHAERCDRGFQSSTLTEAVS